MPVNQDPSGLLDNIFWEPNLADVGSKPAGDVTLDTSNPLTKGMAVYALDGIDLVSGSFLDKNGPLGFGIKERNKGFEIISTNSQFLTVPAPLLDGSNNGWTILLRAQASGDINTRIMVEDPNARVIQSAFDKTVDANFDAGNFTGANNEWPFDTTAYVGKRANFATRRYSVLVNGKEAAGFTRGSQLGNISAGNWKIGFDGAAWQRFFWWSHFIIWNRHVTDDEIRELDRDEWQVLKSANQPYTTQIPEAAPAGGSLLLMNRSIANNGGMRT